MARLAVSSIGDGALLLQSELWATNSVLVPAGRECLICDPSLFADELEELRGVSQAYERVHLLITHSDYDHTCGIGAFPDAIVAAGAGTAQAIEDGSARRKLDDGERLWSASWPGALRVDVVLAGPSASCGSFVIATIEVPGHAADGSAFVLVERGLLLAGDYLSAVSYPHVLGSMAGAIAAHERLLAACEEYDVVTVVPGHGPALDRREALRIGHADLDYLRTLREAACRALRTGASRGAATLEAFAVPPPRPARSDFEAFGVRTANAERAVAEAFSAALVASSR